MANASANESQSLNKSANTSSVELANKTAVETPVVAAPVIAQKNETAVEAAPPAIAKKNETTASKVNTTTTSAIAQTTANVSQTANKTAH